MTATPHERPRWPAEACSVCGAFGPWGWGPPSRPLTPAGHVERRCTAHRWLDFGVDLDAHLRAAGVRDKRERAGEKPRRGPVQAPLL